MLRVVWLVILFTLLGGSARAEVRRRGTVRLEAVSGHGAVELRDDGAGYAGELSIVNEGKEPLVVSRIGIRGDAFDPRVPAKVVARAAEGSLPITVPPGASRKAIVRWTPERGVRQRQLFGHVVVTSSDDDAGEVALGIRAQQPGLLGPIERHLLSLLIAIPLLGALVAFALRLSGRRADGTSRRITLGTLGLQLIVALYIYRGFDPDVSRADGNDGLQFIEHAVWIRPLEIYLGLDGIAATAILITTLLAGFAVLAERRQQNDAAAYHATVLVLVAALLGTLVAMDGLLFVLFAAVVVVAAGFLAAVWGRASALRAMVPGLVALALLAAVLVLLAAHADASLLVDGEKVTTLFSLPELSRASFDAQGTLLGFSIVRVAFGVVLAVALFFLASFPFHRWLGRFLAQTSPATGILVASAFPTLGLCILLRIGCAVLPDAMRWASGVVVALGAVSAAYGAFAAFGQTDLRRLAACTATSQAGFVLLGAGSLTPQGLSGAVVLGGTRGLACGVFLLLAAAIEERAKTTDTARLAGVGTQMPGFAIALGIAGFAQAGLLGLGGAWGPFLALLGVLAGYAPLAIVAALALVVLAAAHLRPLVRFAFGKLDPDWTRNVALEPFGGRFPELGRHEWPSIAPLVAIVVVFGLWPAPMIHATTGTVRDLANAVSPPGPDQVAFR